jgi:hypothetical protein
VCDDQRRILRGEFGRVSLVGWGVLGRSMEVLGPGTYGSLGSSIIREYFLADELGGLNERGG